MSKLENAIDATELCRHCLMCRHVCPIGNITRMETLTPHGWAQLVALERRGLSTWNPETVDALYKCADCGSCRAHSVYSTPLPEAIAAARAEVVEQGLAPALVYELGDLLRKWQNLYAPQLPEPSSGTGATALFIGDDAQLLRPQQISSVLALLRAVGVDPVLIGQGRNTGFVATSLGLPDVAHDLASATLEEIVATGAQRVFVLAPGEFFALTQAYDERLGLSVPDGVEVIEVIPFLAESLAAGKIAFNRLEDDGAYAYVDPTHSVRVPARYDAPRRLLEAVLPTTPRELFWRNERAYPCGDLALQFTQPQLADALTQARLKDAVDVGATAVITEGAGSLAHLDRHAAEYGLRVIDLYDLLRDRLAT